MLSKVAALSVIIYIVIYYTLLEVTQAMQNIRKKLLSILLTIIMIVTALPMTASAEDTVTVIEVSNAEELTTACSTINENGGTYTISMKADFEGSVSINNPNAVVTLVGNGHTLSGNTNFININHGTLNLGDGKTELTLKGGSDNDNPGIVYIIYSDAVCNMYDKVTIKDHEGNTNLGGGVTVESGVFHMYGGTINNCGINGGSVAYGGGVAVYGGGSFIMDGGVISDCYAQSEYIDDQDPNRCFTAMGGGVFVTGGSSFTMNGGMITNCYADAMGGGVAMVECGSYPSGYVTNTVTINGGVISGNTSGYGGGVFASGHFYAYVSPIAAEQHIGNDTQPTPGLFINGGEIAQNEASYGGGVCLALIRPSIGVELHNAIISENEANFGGGVCVYAYWTAVDIDGCTITDNVAAGNGGGIGTTSNTDSYGNGYTSIKNTVITGNTSGDRGAGVFYDDESKLYISGANTIQENYYNGTLNNLNVYSVDHPVYVNGALTGSQIGLSDPELWDDGLSDAEAPDDGSAELLTNGYKDHNPVVHPEEYFTSDHETWYVDRSAKTTTTVEDPSLNKRREYTVKRHPLEDGVYPMVYAGNYVTNGTNVIGAGGQFEITAIQNPSVTVISSTDDIINELMYRFPESQYTRSFGGNTSAGYIKYTYTPKFSGSPLSSVDLEKRPDQDYVTITYYPIKDTNRPPTAPSTATMRTYGGKVTYKVSLTNQTEYANPGELVLQISSDGSYSLVDHPDLYGFDFSDDCTEETIEYVDYDPPRNVLYEYNEYGDITAKLEIVSCETKSATTTTETGTEEEVRLVRRENAYKVVFHENNPMLDNKNFVFKTYQSSETGMKIDHFYDIPAWAGDEYVFAGWYHNNDYSKSPDNADIPVDFENDTYSHRESGADYHIYAKWIKVGTVGKDTKDANIFDGDYRGFGLVGVQFREPGMYDDNYEKQTPGGLRFVTSLKESLISKIDALSDQKVDNVDVEYGYAVGTEENINAFISNYGITDTANYKLQYKGENVNGVDTDPEKGFGTSATDFRYITNVNCTRGITNADGTTIKKDHRNFTDYRLYTLVVTYEEDSADKKNEKIDARAYIRYYDANNKLRVFYNDYKKDTYYGGCLCSFNQVEGMAIPQDPDLLEEQQRPEG